MHWTEEQLAEYQTRRQSAGQTQTTEPPLRAKTGEQTTPLIRQSRKGINKTEQRFVNEILNYWKHEGAIDEIGDHESITLKLANGLRYTPDFPTWSGGKLTFYEVKGAHAREDSLIKLKMAAGKYPQFRFWLYRWAKGMWTIQEVLA